MFPFMVRKHFRVTLEKCKYLIMSMIYRASKIMASAKKNDFNAFEFSHKIHLCQETLHLIAKVL